MKTYNNTSLTSPEDQDSDQCCVWHGSAIDSWTKEASLPQDYVDGRCTKTATHEVNENGSGWKLICATHVDVMKGHVLDLKVRPLVFVIAEEPERTDEEIEEIVEELWMITKRMGKELHEQYVQSPGYKPSTVKTPDIDDLLKNRLRESLRGSLRKK